MGNTLVDEPLPPTKSEPPAGDRPTLDDLPGGDRLTVDDVPQGVRRGPSPTLIDGPPVPRRASPTLADGPPPKNYPTPAAAPLYVVPAQPPAPLPAPPPPPAAAQAQRPMVAPQPLPVVAPAAAPQPQAPVETAAPAAVHPAAMPPQAAPQPLFISPPTTTPRQSPLQQAPSQQAPSQQAPSQQAPSQQAPSPEPGSAPSAQRAAPSKEFVSTLESAQSPPAAPPVHAPPPIAYPGRAAPAAGLLAQLPAMPAARPGPLPFAAPAPPLAEPAPHPGGAPSLSAQQASHSPAPAPAPAPFAAPTPEPVSIPTPVMSAPVLTPARDAIPAPPPVVSPPAIAMPAPVAAQAAPMAAPVVLDHMPAPMRLAAGARTLVGVAPASPPGVAPSYPAGTGQYSPPGQTSTPSPHDPTLPVTNAVEAPRKAGSPGAANPGAPVSTSGAAPSDDPSSSTAASAAPSGAAPSAGSHAAPKPRGRARTVVAVLFAVIGVLAIAGVTIGYFLFFRYAPLADHHIPAASNLAIRADVRRMGTFGPVRKHLWPVIFDRPSQKVSGKTLADRLGDATGIHPALDAREIIIASVDARSWVVLVGGSFEPGAFVPGLQKVLHDEGLPEWQKSGDLLIGPGGVAVAQADDGTLVLGTEAEIVTAALPSSEEHKRMDLPKDGALAFAVSKEAWEEMSRNTAMFDPGGALRRIRHVRGTFTLGDDPRVDLAIEPKGGENAEALGKDVEQLLSLLRLGLVAVPDQVGEKSALSSAKVTVEEGRVRVRGPWPLEGLDRGCAKLAVALGAK